MGIKQLYNYNLWKLSNEYGDVSVMEEPLFLDALLTEIREKELHISRIKKKKKKKKK